VVVKSCNRPCISFAPSQGGEKGKLDNGRKIIFVFN
jgi:hypothetical protein